MPYLPIIIKADTLAEAWEKSISELMQKGVERFVQAPDFLTNQKEAPVFIIVENPLKQPRLHAKAPAQLEEATKYAKHVIFGTGDDANENKFDYTYYARFRCYPDCEVRAEWPNIVRDANLQETIERLCGGKCKAKTIDQVQLAIDTLKKDPSRRSVVLVSWIPSRDSIKFGPKREKTSSPCIVYIQPQIVENKLHLFVVMKTNDLFNAWPLNAFAMTELQKYMAEEIGVEIGIYTHFSVSMHIYQDMYDSAKELISKK